MWSKAYGWNVACMDRKKQGSCCGSALHLDERPVIYFPSEKDRRGPASVTYDIVVAEESNLKRRGDGVRQRRWCAALGRRCGRRRGRAAGPGRTTTTSGEIIPRRPDRARSRTTWRRRAGPKRSPSKAGTPRGGGGTHSAMSSSRSSSAAKAVFAMTTTTSSLTLR